MNAVFSLCLVSTACLGNAVEHSKPESLPHSGPVLGERLSPSLGCVHASGPNVSVATVLA